MLPIEAQMKTQQHLDKFKKREHAITKHQWRKFKVTWV